MTTPTLNFHFEVSGCISEHQPAQPRYTDKTGPYRELLNATFPVLERDIKILWGRSGNRCAICKLELTPDGSRATLGEMAHIVARSLDGPRGNDSLSTEDRDRYDNLILLCPTHHVEIDKNPDLWPTTRLLTIKREHEAWVSDQLSAGRIAVSSIDNSAFLEEREAAWIEASPDHVAIALSLTPLRVSGEAVDPLDRQVVSTLEQAQVPSNGCRTKTINRYRTRPTAHGVANEDFPEPVSSFGHSIQIFRVGHCEYFYRLGASVDQITAFARERSADLGGASRVVRYTDVAEVSELGLTWLQLAWQRLLPFNDMTFSGAILSTKGTTMYSRQDDCHFGVFGYPVQVPVVRYSQVISKSFDRATVLLDLLRRIVNSYGLILHSLKDDKEEFTRPERMR